MTKRIVRFVLLLLGILALLGATLFVALRWDSIPAEIPTQFDGAGRPESFSAKSSLLGMLIAGWLFFAATAVIARVPALWKKNGGFVRVSSLRIGGKTLIEPNWLSMDLMSDVVALLFSYLSVCSALCRPLGAWFLPLLFASLLLSFVVPSLLLGR